MNKTTQRTLKTLYLVRLHAQPQENSIQTMDNGKQNVRQGMVGDGNMTEASPTISSSRTMSPSPTMLSTTSMSVDIPSQPFADNEARQLLKRTPHSYLLNQIYGLWFYASYFLFLTLITRRVATEQYGIFAVALTAYNTILYTVSFGLEDALTTYVPRVFAEHGRAAASLLIRRLLGLRITVLLLSMAALVFGLPLLANLIALIPIKGAMDTANVLRDPVLLGHITPIAIYVVGSGIGSLLTAVCAALMRMRVVLVVSGLTQLVQLVFAYVVLQRGLGINGVLWLLAILWLLNAAAFAFWLAPILLQFDTPYKQPLKPVIQLGFSAWLTNLASGALFKQVSIILLGIYAISLTKIGQFNLAFQLADSANLLLVAGFGGVGGSALAAAVVGKNYDRLARSWQALIKIETLLAAPVLLFALFNAQNIVIVLYRPDYAPVGPLLAIFLFFNIIYRILGTTIHQYTLYVINKAYLVVLSQLLGLLAILLLGILFIPHLGAAGALTADGVAKALTGALMLFFLWRRLPRKYPLGFTVRLLLAVTLAALPSILWHPSNSVLLGVTGVLFLVLCVGLLLIMKPLNKEDLEMVEGVSPKVVKYLRWFARG